MNSKVGLRTIADIPMCGKFHGMNDHASDLLALNERLRAGTIFFDNFEGMNASDDLYSNLERFGLARSNVMILSITPDGDDTVIGYLVTRTGEFFTFDVDLADPEYSRVECFEISTGEGTHHSVGTIEAAARWFRDH